MTKLLDCDLILYEVLNMKEYPETHQQGTISIENIPEFNYIKGDLGIHIAKDGRVWICIDGIAFLRFSPHTNGKMQPD